MSLCNTKLPTTPKIVRQSIPIHIESNIPLPVISIENTLTPIPKKNKDGTWDVSDMNKCQYFGYRRDKNTNKWIEDPINGCKRPTIGGAYCRCIDHYYATFSSTADMYKIVYKEREIQWNQIN